MFEYEEPLLTIEDYELFPSDGRRHEIIGGAHHMTPAPGTRHQNILRLLGMLLNEYLRSTKRGILYFSPVDVVLSPHDIVQPDIVVILSERKGIITEKNIAGAPDLVIEILSKHSFKEDRMMKRKLYEKFGVKEYWIIDPFSDSVTIYASEKGRFKKGAELEIDDILNSSLLPGLEIGLHEIFSEEDLG
jgi:Uma2 family endonuclease